MLHTGQTLFSKCTHFFCSSVDVRCFLLSTENGGQKVAWGWRGLESPGQASVGQWKGWLKQACANTRYYLPSVQKRQSNPAMKQLQAKLDVAYEQNIRLISLLDATKRKLWSKGSSARSLNRQLRLAAQVFRQVHWHICSSLSNCNIGKAVEMRCAGIPQ